MPCDESDFSQLTLELCTSPDPKTCLLAKAMIGLLNAKDHLTHVNLTDQELNLVLELLKPNSSSFLYISECSLPNLLKGLRASQQNVVKFKQCNLDGLLQQRSMDPLTEQSESPHMEGSDMPPILTKSCDQEQERASVINSQAELDESQLNCECITSPSSIDQDTAGI